MVVYLPVLVETVVVTLAIARIGAIHSLVFGGFSAEAVRFRLEDTGAKLLVTSDGQFRRGPAVATKAAADAAVAGLPGADAEGRGSAVEHVLVVRRTGDATPDVPWTDGSRRVVARRRGRRRRRPRARGLRLRDAAVHHLHVRHDREAQGPRAHLRRVPHRTRRYTHWAHFDAKPDDVHWCTADLAWVTAHTYEIYGPLANGLTQVIYEGTPDVPHRRRGTGRSSSATA